MTALLLACAGSEPADSTTPPGTTVPEDLDYTDGNFLYQREEILEFAVALDDDALAALEAVPEDDVHATFTFGEENWDVGLHLKGSPSGSFRTMDEKAAFKIDFHQWDEDASFHGVRRLTLNNMVQDGTMAHEHAAYELFRRLGVPGPRHGYARVYINDEWYGLYGVAETMDEQWVDRAFPDDDDGNLYEGGYGGDLQEGCAQLFDIKEQDDVADYADLQALIDLVLAVAPDAVLELLEAEFDVEPLFAMWAAELVIADIDGYATYGNNFMLYHAPVAGRWTMIPWGPDQAYQEDQAVEFAYGGELMELCSADAACTERLEEAVEEAAESMAEAEYVAFVDDETARIEADCRADPRSSWGDYGCRDEQAAMRQWVRDRPAAVTTLLAE